MAQETSFKICSISNYLAVHEDSKLCIFDLINSFKLQDIVLPCTLSNITAFEWSNKIVQKRVLRNKRHTNSRIGSDCLAIGLNNGEIIFYSILKSEYIGSLKNGHTSKVNDIHWSTNNSHLIACDQDGKIILWDVIKQTKQKEIESASQVKSLSSFNDFEYVLSAGKDIKLWKMDDCSLVKVFNNAHVAGIDYICFINKDTESQINNFNLKTLESKNKRLKNGDSLKVNGTLNGVHKELNHVVNDYTDFHHSFLNMHFISSKFSDMDIKGWSLCLKEDENIVSNLPLITFCNSLPLKFIDINIHDSVVYISAILTNGTINLFKAETDKFFNPTPIKPINPSNNITFKRKFGKMILKNANSDKTKITDEYGEEGDDNEILLPILFAKFVPGSVSMPNGATSNNCNNDNKHSIHNGEKYEKQPKLLVGYSNIVLDDISTNGIENHATGNLLPSNKRQRTNSNSSLNNHYNPEPMLSRYKINPHFPFIVETLDLEKLTSNANIFYRNISTESITDLSPIKNNTNHNLDTASTTINTLNNPEASRNLGLRIRHILAEKQKLACSPNSLAFPLTTSSSLKPLQQQSHKTDSLLTHSFITGEKSNTNLSAPSISHLIPKANSLAVTIIQALKSDDQNKFYDIIHNKSDIRVIEETINRLPLICINAFIYQLGNKLASARTNEFKTLLRWFNSVLLHHASHIVSTPELSRTLFAIQELLSERTAYMLKLIKLNGLIKHTKLAINLQQKQQAIHQNTNIVDTNSKNFLYEDSDTEIDDDQGDF